MKKALVLAGGIAQVALLNELKSRGYFTMLADMNPSCVAAKYADEFYQISAMDIEEIGALVKEKSIDMVLTACADQILVAEVRVCEDLGLKTYIDSNTTDLVSNKHLMKDIFIKNEIPTSKYVVLEDFDERSVSGLNFPVVVKPVDAYSARGVNRCNNLEELKANYTTAISFSRSKKAVVEEFVDGDEITVEAFIREGKAYVLCIGSKQKLSNGKFVLAGSIYPADISAELIEEINITTQKIADAFHLINSPLNINMITDGKHAYVLEFCARTGGFVKYEITRIMSGFDPIKAIVDLREVSYIDQSGFYALTDTIANTESTIVTLIFILPRDENFNPIKEKINIHNKTNIQFTYTLEEAQKLLQMKYQAPHISL